MNLSQNGSIVPKIPDYYKESLGLVITRLSFETAIALAGVVGNILVCIVIASKRLRGRASMHYYLLNLALADIGVLTVIFPIAVVRERIPGYWPFGRIVCLYIYPFVDTFYGASIWFITSIAFQRYRKIVVKGKGIHGESSSTRQIICNLLLIWLVSFLIASFPLFFIFTYFEDTKNNKIHCWPAWEKAPHKSLSATYTVSLIVFSYVLPLAVISWTYVGIWREIRMSNLFHQSLDREAGGSSNNKIHKRLNENARAKKILTPIVVTFAVTMLPVSVFRLLVVFWKPLPSIHHFWTFYNTMVIMTIANSAANPIIYSVVSREFRSAFIKLILRREHSILSRLPSKSDAHTKVTNDKRKRSFNVATPFSPKTWPDAKQLKETVL
ncbi:galanin receptor type 1-like [Actinia tenebrosa]|uniref:Galanin receptor type 1-like n=1 Tax=Actinia tenebrosa TaxID=6105 RepID=A0A6P8HL26_ACTTE|nr:galanin receptor type 1-like [Actinia tenebrosa]